MRPTGRLHLGHLVGALQNWEQLQREYDCFYFVADWHALTSEYAATEPIVDNALDNVADWIGAGIDPEKSTLFVQSLVPEHAELYLLLQMVTPIPWLERVPTYKEQMEQLAEKDLSNLGFLGLSAAADRRRRHLRRALRAGGRRPGAAPRAVARGRAALPQLLWRACSSSRSRCSRRRRGCRASTTGR